MGNIKHPIKYWNEMFSFFAIITPVIYFFVGNTGETPMEKFHIFIFATLIVEMFIWCLYNFIGKYDL